MSTPTGPSINSSLSLEKPAKAVLVAAQTTCHVDHLGIIAYDVFCLMQFPVQHVIRLTRCDTRSCPVKTAFMNPCLVLTCHALLRQASRTAWHLIERRLCAHNLKSWHLSYKTVQPHNLYSSVLQMPVLAKLPAGAHQSLWTAVSM